MKRDCYVNIIALSEVYLKTYKDKLKDKKELVIELINKDNLLLKEITIEKENLSKTLIDIFENEIKNLKKITLNYIDKTKVFLTEINVF